MKSVNEAPAVQCNREDWVPLMELAVREVFAMMLSTALEVPKGPTDGSFDATSMVGLAGKVRAILTFSCSAKAAALMASKLLNVEAVEGSLVVLDSLGEVCNMVAGNFKNKVAVLGDGCMLSVPTVITGKNYSMHSLADSAALEVRLLFENMPIVISLRTQS